MNSELRKKIGQTIAVGFHGTSAADDGVKNVLAQAEAGIIGGVIIYRYNIENPRQLKELLSLFRNAKTEYPLFTMLDQEGGKVQRIRASNGFSDFLSAQKVSKEMTSEQAYEHYRHMGALLRETGFNFNFAPCVDVNFDPPCEVIGKLERSYSTDPEIVARYAGEMVRAMRDEHVASCLKHFPGHGSSRGDSHMGLVDITNDWKEAELEPYKKLQRAGLIDSIMSAHLIHNSVEQDTPITFSSKWIKRLRKEVPFDGVVVTDDLHMGAIIHNYSLEEIVVRTLAAGHNLLIFSNNPLASQMQGIRHDEQSNSGADAKVPNVSIPERAIQEIESAVSAGRLSEERIGESIKRVIVLKASL